MDGLELLRRLKERQIPHPVIVITGHGQIPLVVEAFRAGAFDYIEKPFSDEAVLAAVRAALEEGFHRQASELDRRTALATLTTREHQVLDGLMAGRSNKVIAHDLGISPRTVESHRANLMLKSGAQNLPGLVRMAVTLGTCGEGSGGGGEGLPAAL
jgi:two-component system response regulator FixJ